MDNNNIVFDVIYLINCSLHGNTADFSIVKNMDMNTIKNICKMHKISALVSLALKHTDEDDYWDNMKNNAIRKTLLYAAEKDKLFKFLNAEKIWYLPLKGTDIAQYYPEYGIREFSDIDVFFDKKYQSIVKDYFVNQGYAVKTYNKSNHDKYVKEPLFKFEMHTSLFSDLVDSKIKNYYKDLYDKTIKKTATSELSLNDNDLYLYIMAHAVKHYNYAGTGLRTLVDIYLLVKNLVLDWKYINSEFSKMGISKEAIELKDLSLILFSGNEYKLTEKQFEILSRIMKMGVYGTSKSKIDNSLSKMSKGKLIKERLFVPVETIKSRHPLVYKYRVLLPGFYIWRFIKGITIKSKRTLKELQLILRHK